jgi:hypothetical protein
LLFCWGAIGAALPLNTWRVKFKNQFCYISTIGLSIYKSLKLLDQAHFCLFVIGLEPHTKAFHHFKYPCQKDNPQNW